AEREERDRDADEEHHLAEEGGRAHPRRRAGPGVAAVEVAHVRESTGLGVAIASEYQWAVRKLQTQGVPHITIVGADRQTSIDFWEGVLGMPFVFEQPNLDNPSESHLYFDPGDGRLITIFTNEDRVADPERTPTDPGCVHHLAFNVSNATF